MNILGNDGRPLDFCNKRHEGIYFYGPRCTVCRDRINFILLAIFAAVTIALLLVDRI